MRPVSKPGFWLVAQRECRWLFHDRVALLLIFGVPLFAFVVLTTVFSHPVIRGLGVTVVDEDNSDASRALVEYVAASPSLNIVDRRVTVELKLVASKGEYASWRATRASGDFDLRTFSIRAYPVQPVPELRPGMSAYLDWRTRQ